MRLSSTRRSVLRRLTFPFVTAASSNGCRLRAIPTRHRGCQNRGSSSLPLKPTATQPTAATSTTRANAIQDNPCTNTELSHLREEIARLSYLIKKISSQQMETQDLSRRAEARAYIIENKLIDIQNYAQKIPALENVTQNLRQYLKDYSPAYFSNVFQRVNQSSAAPYLTKYTLWLLCGGVVLIWQYRKTMYEQTSEEIANVASLTLQQESLRETIQDTLTAVASSPETLASLSVLFQDLIREARTERHLIDLIVRALRSDGVRDASFYLLDLCLQDPALQARAGEFLKLAAHATVLDEGVQKSTGVGIQQALKSAVLPRWAKTTLGAPPPPLPDGNDKHGEIADEAGGSAPDAVTVPPR